MAKADTSRLLKDWEELVSNTDIAIRKTVEHIAIDSRETLVQDFFDQLLGDEQAALFLDQEKVQHNLVPHLHRWVVEIFSCARQTHLETLIAAQEKIGETHARIQLPVSLVLIGTRILKDSLSQILLDRLPFHEAATTIYFASRSVDLAIEAMSVAFSQSFDRDTRAEDTYRLFSITNNSGLEQFRQKAALFEWECMLLNKLLSGDSDALFSPLGDSDFGLWFRHKAEQTFNGASEIPATREQIRIIDQECIPILTSGDGERSQTIRKIRQCCKTIHFLLHALFEHATSLDSGRDALTQMLNRKFLPVVMNREISLAQRMKKQFAVLIIDIDHFKRVNDTYGHEVGDMVLQQTASILSNRIRAGDFAFRYGGEEFLLILVDIDLENAVALAERIRKRFEIEPFFQDQEEPLHITVSIGIAMYDGYPDYKKTIQRSDMALFSAKEGGRNRVVVAD